MSLHFYISKTLLWHSLVVHFQHCSDVSAACLDVYSSYFVCCFPLTGSWCLILTCDPPPKKTPKKPNTILKPMWKAQKDRSAVTCMKRHAIRQRGNVSVLRTTAWRWETLLHTNCAHSAGPEPRMAVITPTRALFTRSSRGLWSCQPSIQSNRRTETTGNYIIMMPAPHSHMIPIVSHQSASAQLLMSVYVHLLFLPGWFCCHP